MTNPHFGSPFIGFAVFFFYEALPTRTLSQQMEEKTIIFGLPVPSTNKVFLAFVVLHILMSLVCVLSGLFAMLAVKGGKRHLFFGRVYFFAMLSAFATVLILSIMRWPHNNHLLMIGIFAVSSVYFGYRNARAQLKNWTRRHTVFMGFSYIFLLTGFYVDNGKNLPLWKLFPQWFFWIFPAAIGIPVIVRVLKRHPLNRPEKH
jgi:hypothetical protein